MKKTRKISLSAVLCAMGVIILYFGAVFDVMFLTMAAISSFIVVYAVIEIGGSFPWLIYAATSVLSMLLLPNKLPALTYLLFAGVYPIVKSYCEKLHTVLSWILKLVFFNIALALLIFLTKNVFGIPDMTFGFSLPVFAVGNLIFLLFDYVMTKLITFYLMRLQKRFGSGGKFGH